MKSKLFSGIFALLLLSACAPKEVDNTGLAARVGDRTLSIEEVSRNIPPSVSVEDSIKLASTFIQNWVEEQTVTAMAERMIPQTEEINRMVEDYRRQLIMLYYRRMMAQQKGNFEPQDSDIEQYYEAHVESLKLKRPVVKGIYIKIADDDRNLPEIRRLYRSDKVEDMDRLEKLITKAVNYDFFRDKWVDWQLIESRIPSPEIEAAPETFPLTHDHIDFTDDGYVYLVHIADRIAAQQTMPLDFAKEPIREALERENAVTFDKSLRRQLLDKALEEGSAQIFVDIN